MSIDQLKWAVLINPVGFVLCPGGCDPTVTVVSIRIMQWQTCFVGTSLWFYLSRDEVFELGLILIEVPVRTLSFRVDRLFD